MKAVWNGSIIAESDQTRIVENNHYFPMEAIREEFFIESNKESRCAWKGKASYFHIEVKGQTNENAAWYYPNTSYAAKPIENYVAFWKGVKVTD